MILTCTLDLHIQLVAHYGLVYTTGVSQSKLHYSSYIHNVAGVNIAKVALLR